MNFMRWNGVKQTLLDGDGKPPQLSDDAPAPKRNGGHINGGCINTVIVRHETMMQSLRTPVTTALALQRALGRLSGGLPQARCQGLRAETNDTQTGSHDYDDESHAHLNSPLTSPRALGRLSGGLRQTRRPWARCEEGMHAGAVREIQRSVLNMR